MKQIILGLAVLLAATSAQATFPNTYKTSYSGSYDATTGSSGTYYLTVTITGHMSIPGCPAQYQHTPAIKVKMPNGTWTPQVLGPAVPVCSEIAYSHVFSFDLGSVGCVGFPEESFSCIFTSDTVVICPVMGASWFEDNFAFGIEWAWTRVTTSQCRDIGNGTTRCLATYYCNGGSSPPDYQPQAIVANIPPATFPPFWLAGAVGFRIPDSVGVPWHFPGADLASVVPGDGRWKIFLAPAVPWNGGNFICTVKDKDLGTILPWPF